jgi:hypothetical protein
LDQASQSSRIAHPHALPKARESVTISSHNANSHAAVPGTGVARRSRLRADEFGRTLFQRSVSSAIQIVRSVADVQRRTVAG